MRCPAVSAQALRAGRQAVGAIGGSPRFRLVRNPGLPSIPTTSRNPEKWLEAATPDKSPVAQLLAGVAFR
jgi:hypothetical protein